MKKPFALAVNCFHIDRLRPFLDNLREVFKSETPCDLYFIHNKFEVEAVKNRYTRSQEEVDQVSELLDSFDMNHTVIDRDNIGEDVGASHHFYTLHKQNYDYMFFMNELTKIHRKGWIDDFYKYYEANPDAVAATTQVCRGIRYPYCMPTTYWSIRTSFDLKWEAPRNRTDAGIQEMELVWPQANSQGKFIAQVGDGSWLSYKNGTTFSEGLY